MKITFLGTGTSQGVPVICCKCDICTSLDYRNKRLRVSVHLQINDTSIIIDAGPDFRQQILRSNIKSLDAILLTHEHKDHTAGLDDIRAFNFKQGKPIPIYGRENVLEQIKREYAYAFTEKKYPGIPQMDLRIIENSKFIIDDVEITPIEVLHHKLPVFGFRINDFTYITDANSITINELEKAFGSKVFVLNALQKEAHLSHFTLNEAIEIVEFVKPEKSYFTHISHKLGLHADIENELPSHIRLAYDGLEINI